MTTHEVRANLNIVNYVITVRLRGLEKTYAHVSKNCYRQTWGTGRLKGTNSVQSNLKVTDDSIVHMTSHDFSKKLPVNIYLFKVNIRNTRKSCEICPKLTIKTPERRQLTSF